ncbi:MAG: hypothetical protein HETSPECPRED_004585 [Heterodermia speciosa]|uniref:Uncharacterized protein n=1 Tax=Heterodermia speciosa TaxID=116794 RepID=A0A8H3FA70_9LECA|nr:MAG: hypothetical protein HETSPECPRED_004585 [Heterodermia speciosa]
MTLLSATLRSGVGNKSVSQSQFDVAELQEDKDQNEQIARLEHEKKLKAVRKAQREQKRQMKAIKAQKPQDTTSVMKKPQTLTLEEEHSDYPRPELDTSYGSAFWTAIKDGFHNASSAAQRYSIELSNMFVEIPSWLWTIIFRLPIWSWLRLIAAKEMVWVSWIAIIWMAVCWLYVHLWRSNRSTLDIFASGICKPSYAHGLCAKACEYSLGDNFPTICTRKEVQNETFTFQDTYGLFANMVGLKTTMSEIPSRLVDDRQYLGFHLTRFKSLNHEELGISVESQENFIRLGDYIYEVLVYMPDYLMAFFGHVDSMTDIVLFQSGVTKKEIDGVIQTNRLNLDASEPVQVHTHQSAQKLLKAQKLLNLRFLDHASVWREKNSLLITPGKTIKDELLKLGPAVSSMRSNLETIQRRIEAERHVIVRGWCLILRMGKSWRVFDIEPEDVQPYTHALDVINDLESNYAQLQSHFTPLWDITTKINIRLEQLVLKASRKQFHLEPGKRGLIQLQEMYEAFNSDAKGIKMAINDANVIKPKQVSGTSTTVSS